jgi:adenine phosphoribosyltransferase
MAEQDYYPIDIAGIKRELPKFEVAPGVTIAVLNILGDTELVTAAARALAEQLRAKDFKALITAEAKSIPLIHALSVELDNMPYVVLRKSYKPYMGAALKSTTESITTGKEQTLYLDEKDHDLVRGDKVAIIDDVISTGSTVSGIREILDQANATIAVEAAILTEGHPEQWQHIIALGHLPLWIDDEAEDDGA